MRAGKPMVLIVRMIALPVRKSVKNHLIFSQIRVIRPRPPGVGRRGGPQTRLPGVPGPQPALAKLLIIISEHLKKNNSPIE